VDDTLLRSYLKQKHATDIIQPYSFLKFLVKVDYWDTKTGLDP